MHHTDTYSPVDPDFIEIIEEYIQAQSCGKVHFFGFNEMLQTEEGRCCTIEVRGDGEFLVLHTGKAVRLDKIVTIFGKPGMAYEAYSKYAEACLACEDLGQF